MVLFLDESRRSSLFSVLPNLDGSFGLGASHLLIDYEINFSENGSIGAMCRLLSPRTGQCMCLIGYSWKLFKRLRTGNIDLSASKEAALCFGLEDNDPEKWGTNSGFKFSATLFDPHRFLVLFGEMPDGALFYEFAIKQYAVVSNNRVCGFVIECPWLR